MEVRGHIEVFVCLFGWVFLARLLTDGTRDSPSGLSWRVSEFWRSACLHAYSSGVTESVGAMSIGAHFYPCYVVGDPGP